MKRGDIYWASLPDPVGSGPGFKRPVIIVQSDEFNESKIRTVVVVAVTSNARLALAPGNVLMRRRQTGLSKDSVANVSQIITIDKQCLTQRIHGVPFDLMRQIDQGVALVLGLNKR